MRTDGTPYAEEMIRVRQLKHAFDFGVVLKQPYFSELDSLENHIAERVKSCGGLI